MWIIKCSKLNIEDISNRNWKIRRLLIKILMIQNKQDVGYGMQKIRY